MANSYLWLKTLHIFGVVLFLGNIIVTGWWKNRADATKDPKIIAFAQRQVTLTDYIFTAGGVAILLVAGLMNVVLHDLKLSSEWLAHGMGFFVASGLIWCLVLIPVQTKQAAMATQFAEDGVIPAAYWKLCQRWNIYGVIATLLPLINLYWMVFKPA